MSEKINATRQLEEDAFLVTKEKERESRMVGATHDSDIEMASAAPAKDVKGKAREAGLASLALDARKLSPRPPSHRMTLTPIVLLLRVMETSSLGGKVPTCRVRRCGSPQRYHLNKLSPTFYAESFMLTTMGRNSRTVHCQEQSSSSTFLWSTRNWQNFYNLGCGEKDLW